ncbi:MAG: hypothetical protein QXT28_10830 [Thermofilaceae archaeon]
MEDYVKALADRIYGEYRGRRVTLDRLGRPSYVAVYAMVKALVRLALENGLDPAAVDFYALIDPDLTRSENIAAIARSLRLKQEGPHPPADTLEEEIHALRGQFGELEARRGAEAARRARERRAPPPPAPPARVLTPEEERALLWLKFSTVLRSWGYDPERFRSDFEAAVRLTEGRPLLERQEVLDRILAHLRPPPAELVERVVGAVRRLEEAVRRLEAARAPPLPEVARVAFLAMLPEPAVTVGKCPNAAGLPDHDSVQPTPECVGAMRHIGIHPLLVEWWMSCPRCRGFLPGGYLTPSEWVEDVFDRHGLYPAVYKPWFERLARLKEEEERRRGERPGGPRWV